MYTLNIERGKNRDDDVIDVIYWWCDKKKR